MSDQPTTATHLRQRDAFADAVQEVVAAVNDEENFGAAVSQMTQLAHQLDFQQLLNTPHTPQGATAEQEQELRSMLERIPDGFGRWIDCGPGWYPLLITLHTKLLELVPNYQIGQIKEKYGQLCYYWTSGGIYDHSYPGDLDDVRPDFDGSQDEIGESAGWQDHLERCRQWRERSQAWWETTAGQALDEELNTASALADKLVSGAEALSLKTCEVCAQPGQLCCTAAASPWYKTVCDEHRQGMMPSDEWQDWWHKLEPRFEAWQRGNFLRRHAEDEAVVICADADRRIILPQARYIHDPDQARVYANSDSFAMVFVATDHVGQAFMHGLEARYRDHGQAVLAEQQRRTAEGDHYAINNYRPRPEEGPDIHHLDHTSWHDWTGNHNHFTTIDTMDDGVFLSGWNYQTYFDDGPTLPEDAW